MNVEYNPYIQKWYVKGLGFFDNPNEAKKRIRAEKDARKKEAVLTDSILLRISPALKHRLQEIAVSENTTVSEIIRRAVEKEINYGSEIE